MTRGLGRIVTVAGLGAMAAIVWLAIFYGTRPALDVDFDKTPPRLLTGVYPIEREPVTGRSYAWTTDQVTLRLPELDRRTPWTVQLRARGGRPQPSDNPELSFLADGVALETHKTASEYEDISVVIPARPDRRGLTLTLRASSTFVPGPADRRALAVMVDSLRLEPADLVVPPRSAFAGAAATAAAMGVAIAALGVTAAAAIAGTVVLSAGIASAIARGFAPYTDFPFVAARTGVAIGLALVVGAALVRLRQGEPLRNTARFAAIFSASALLLKLLVLLHPDMPIGDALFQAHRYQEVLAGHWLFTSVAPGNYLFPYAPGLYVVALPLRFLSSGGSGDMALLRVVAVVVDSAAGLLLYGLIVRARGDRLGGACAVAIYHLLPLDFGVLSVGNLTNAFAQSLSVGALALMGGTALRVERRLMVALFAALVTAAFLSHTSTFAILSIACAATAVLFWWRGGPALRSPALAVLVGAAVAGLLAVGLYYAHFIDTYRTELARIGGETASAAPDAGGRGILARLTSVPRYLYLYFGIPSLVLAVSGAAALRRRPDRLYLSVAAWTLACGAFLLLGILTPIDMRYYLAAIPAVAVAAGFGASSAWSAGGGLRIAAVVLLGWALVEGVRGWWITLG